MKIPLTSETQFFSPTDLILKEQKMSLVHLWIPRPHMPDDL